MVALARHGGECCGMGHIYGFDHTTPGQFRERVQEFDDDYGIGHTRVLECVLSERQITATPTPGRRNPNVHQEVIDLGGWPVLLAEQGFLLKSSWVNSNSGQRCYAFHRCAGGFENLDNLPFQWPPQARPQQAAPQEAPHFNIGDRVQYWNEGGNRHGQIGTVVRHGGTRLRVQFDRGEAIEEYAITSFRPAPAEEALNVAPDEPIVNATRFHNVFRDGRIGVAHPTYERARERAPRCQRVDRVEVLANGEERRTENYRPVVRQEPE